MTTAQANDAISTSLRELMHSQRELTAHLSGDYPSGTQIKSLRGDLVSRLTGYQTLLLDAGRSVPRTITDEIEIQRRLLDPA